MNRLHPLLAAIAATFLLSAANAPSHTFGRKLGKEEKIKQYGYGIRIIERWSSIPQKPGETKVIGSWQPDQADLELRGDWSAYGCELKVVRFETPGALTGTKEEIEAAKEKREKEKREHKERNKRSKLEKKFNSQTLEEYLEAEYEGARDRSRKQTIKAGRSPNKLTGELLEFTKGSKFVLAALFEELDWSWGVIYEASEDYYEKEWKDLYMKSLKSFRLFEAEGEVYKPAAAKDMKDLPADKKREAIKAGIAGNPGWWAHDTENYVFLTNSENKRFIEGLGKDIETLREKVYEELFPPSNEVTAVCIVRVFNEESEYYQYGGPRGSAGYWDSSREELVLFDNFGQMSETKSKKFTKSVMNHEAFHQYIYYAVGDLAPHSWFNEGHGDYFAGMQIRGSRVSSKPFSWRVNTLKRRMSRGLGLIPIRSLVRLPQQEYYSNAGLKYAQGWALVYYLRRVTKKKDWRAIPDKYFTYLRDNVEAFRQEKKAKGDTSGEGVEGIPGVAVYSFEDAERVEQILKEAVDTAFEGIDYEELQEAYEKWIDSL